MKTPKNDFFVAKSDFFVLSKRSSSEQLMCFNHNNYNHRDYVVNNEPIYSEPMVPPIEQANNSDKLTKFFPDPRDPVQISNHIYEYLVTQRASEAQNNNNNNVNENFVKRRRGSLSSSPSDGSSTTNSKLPDFSSGRKK
jgi:hypothetical protein